MLSWVHKLRQVFQRAHPLRRPTRRFGVEELEDRCLLSGTPLLVNLSATSPINENASTELTGDISEPDSGDSFTLQVNWGDGSPLDKVNIGPSTAPLTPIDLKHQYGGNPPGHPSSTYHVGLLVTDIDDSLTSSNSIDVTVKSVAPTLDGLKATPINEGGVTDLTGSITDLSSVHSYSLAVDWGDGSTPDTFTFAPGTTTFDVTHQYLAPPPGSMGSGDYTINATVTDDENLSGSGSTTVLVSDVAPTIDGLQATPVTAGDMTTLTGSVLDQNSQDTPTLAINWGDTTPVQMVDLGKGGHVVQRHAYLRPQSARSDDERVVDQRHRYRREWGFQFGEHEGRYRRAGAHGDARGQPDDFPRRAVRPGADLHHSQRGSDHEYHSQLG
jgi:hypothetical protein